MCSLIINFIKAITPSYRHGKDPLRAVMFDNSACPYSAISLGELKLTPWVRHKIYKHRHKPALVDTPRNDKKLAVIIPVRDRERHLQQLVPVLQDFLTQQHIKHEIVVIEQADNKLFNKGKLLNIGAKLLLNKCDYFCFHDVDMVPDKAQYAYINYPVLLANSVSQFDADPAKPSKIWHHHATYFGGVILFGREDFQRINGFSNAYWGWGCEDDDLFMRCLLSGLTPLAYNSGRFISLPHKKTITKITDGDKYYQINKKYYKKVRRDMMDSNADGLNSLDYKIVKQENSELYSRIAVCF